MRISMHTHLRKQTSYILRLVLGLFIIASLLSLSGRGVQSETGSALAQAEMPSAPPPPSLYGVEMHNITPAAGLDELVAANTYWIRRNALNWSAVEPNKGNRNWSAVADLKAEVQAAVNQGMQVILIVNSTPTWAQKVTGKYCGPIKSTEFQAFADFMYDLAIEFDGLVNHWEFWNEPDIDAETAAPTSFYGCWGDKDDTTYYGGDYYADMLKAVYPRLKQADASAQVLIGGLLLDCDVSRGLCPVPNDSVKFLEGILANDGGPYFDGVSYHAYDYYGGSLGRYGNSNWQSAWNTTGPVEIVKADFIRALLTQYNVTGKYLVNSELALLCSTGCDATFETTKAYYLAQAYAAALAEGLQANIWYSSIADWRSTALLLPDRTPTPAYHALKFSQSKLYNAQFLRKLVQFSGVTGYEFEVGNRRLWLVWSLDGASHSITISGNLIAAYHVNGDPWTVSSPIMIGVEPMYIEWSPDYTLSLPLISRDYQPLRNGDFEMGLDSQGNPFGWIASRGPEQGASGNGLPYSLVNTRPTFPVVDSSIPLGGSSMLLGGFGFACNGGVPQGYAAVRQTFTVPRVANGVALNLRFKYIMYTQDRSTAANLDRFEVYIQEGANNRLVYIDGNTDKAENCSTWWRVPEVNWKTGLVNLVTPNDLRGKTVTVSFQNWNRKDQWYNTNTYIDDVQLVIGSGN